MTFKEKLQMEHPENVDEVWCGGCRNCPSTYGYEKRRDCGFGNNEEKCAKCWNREMPNTEPLTEKEKMIDAMSENAYNKGLNDAWELAKKIADVRRVDEIFGTYDMGEILSLNTPQEALAKLKAYEEAQKKIEIGDIVKSTIYVDMKCGVVANITDDKASLVHKDGKFSIMVPIEFLVKTGKRIDIQSILEQIGE